MFRHSAWAVGSYSNGPTAAQVVATKSTGGFNHPDGSPCSYLEVEAEHGWHLVLWAEEDCDGDGDGDDVEQLDAVVQVDQPQHAATRVAVRHLPSNNCSGHPA